MSAGAVAVVIPCFNYGRYLGDAIDSVLAQTHAPCRIVVVNDGSVDDTEAVAESFGDQIIYVSQANLGPSEARNNGVRRLAAESVAPEYVVFLDADDTLDPRYIERCIAAVPPGAHDTIVYTQLRFVGDADGVSSYPPFSVEQLKKENIIHASALIPFAAVERRGFVASMRGLEDWDLYLGLASDGYRGVLVDEALLRYRRHGDTATHRLRRQPFRLALRRWRILWRHHRLYGWTGAGIHSGRVLINLVTDLELPRRLRGVLRRLKADT